MRSSPPSRELWQTLLMEIACPRCGESEELRGSRHNRIIVLTCESCGHTWDRSVDPVCPQCGGNDMQAVPLAILEKGRGTQLSVVGTRTIHLCSECDAATLEIYHRNRPNPLLPTEIPTAGL